MSADRELSDFVREHVRSVWALELLLRLRREPKRCWTIEALVAELRASTGLVAENLPRFEQAGLAVSDEAGCWRYAPASAALDGLCARLEAAYRARPVAMISLISRPYDPVKSLADAFRFRNDRKPKGESE